MRPCGALHMLLPHVAVLCTTLSVDPSCIPSFQVNMNMTFGTPSTDNPRPFKCHDCKIAFRIHGHLAKHLRSKMHIMKLECLGKLPFGTYAEIERSGANLNEIDTTDCDNSLESLQVRHNAHTVALEILLIHYSIFQLYLNKYLIVVFSLPPLHINYIQETLMYIPFVNFPTSVFKDYHRSGIWNILSSFLHVY